MSIFEKRFNRLKGEVSGLEAPASPESAVADFVVFTSDAEIHRQPSKFCEDLLLTLKQHKKDVIFWQNGVPFRLCVPTRQDWESLSLAKLALEVAYDERLKLDNVFFVREFPDERDRTRQLANYRKINYHPATMFRREAGMLRG